MTWSTGASSCASCGKFQRPTGSRSRMRSSVLWRKSSTSGVIGKPLTVEKNTLTSGALSWLPCCDNTTANRLDTSRTNHPLG